MRTWKRWMIGLWTVALSGLGAILGAACDDDGAQGPGTQQAQVAVLFVGHGEPSTCEDGDAPMTFGDGSEFGPHGVGLGVPESHQHCEWAAAYEEIATAMTYIFGDLNGNGVLHELAISPAGDVPPFFTWAAFREGVSGYYEAFGNYSPHNDTIVDHVQSLDLQVEGAEIDIHLAFLDAVPRIPDVVWEIVGADRYDKLVVVPMLLASSTHTQEVEEMVREAAHLTSDMEVVMCEPFYEVPYMRARIRSAVVTMAQHLRLRLPAGIDEADIGVLLASHGTPYVPPYSEWGWEAGDIYSNLLLTEDAFHQELAAELPWPTRTGRMNYASPSLEDGLAALEQDGVAHVLVIPSAFPTAAMHTMWDVATQTVGRAVVPKEGIVVHQRSSGMKVYYTAEGYADIEGGRREFRTGLEFIARMGVLEALASGM